MFRRTTSKSDLPLGTHGVPAGEAAQACGDFGIAGREGPVTGDVGVRAATFELDGRRFAVLSFRVPTAVGKANLTVAEREVALAALKGLSNVEIAVRRETSVRTIANQLAAVFKKLGVHSRLELATLAFAEFES